MTGIPRVFIHARPEQPQFGALADGLLAAGFQPVFQRPSGWKRADAEPRAAYCIVDGLRDKQEEIAATYRVLNIPVWVMELPRLRTEPDAWALLLESLHWLPASSTRAAVTPPAITKRFPKNILVIGQKADDASHQMNGAQMATMMCEMVAACRAAHPDLPIVVRPHPLDTQEVPSDIYGADAISVGTKETIREAMRHAAAVVVYNSTSGWDAIAAGVPVVTFARRELCSYYPYTTALTNLVKLTNRQRHDALQRAAGTQWSLTELQSGRAIRGSLLAYTPFTAAVA